MTSTPMRTADEAVAFLMDLVRDQPRPYQARAQLAEWPVHALLARIGNPHTALSVAHIAGSKGKGSTALYLEAILQATGMRTGTFTSPHLQRWTERLRVDARESTPQEFAALFARLQPHVADRLAQDAATAPGFFDTLTAAALLLFAERGVDCAIIEAGIGGRLDATNVVHPALTCITSIELEHTDKLGTSIAAIAGEKAGIIKAGVPVIIGALSQAAQRVVRERAAAMSAPVMGLGREITLQTRSSTAGLALRVRLADREYRAELGAGAGECHARNAALAIACAHHLNGSDGARLQRVLSRVLADTRPPGRMELLSEHPWVLIDGAHTPASTRALAAMLNSIPARRVHLVVSLSAARDAARVLSPLLDRADSVIVTCADASRSLDSAQLAEALIADGYPAKRLRIIPDAQQAVRDTRDQLAAQDLLCVAGSMYMAGVARQTLLGGAPTQARTA